MEKLAMLNRTDLDHIKHVPKGVGNGGYVGILEVFHQLHCLVSLNLLPLPLTKIFSPPLLSPSPTFFSTYSLFP